jgi:hypothetical protein
MSLISRARDLFSMKWVRPVSDHEAGQVLARRAADAKRRAALTLREKQDEVNRRLRDELAAGLVCGRPAR